MASETPHPRAASAPRRARSGLSLLDLLVEVGRGPTRLELVCWQLNVEEPRVRPAWDVARRIGLIDSSGADRITGQAPVYTLTDRGRRAMLELGRDTAARLDERRPAEVEDEAVAGLHSPRPSRL
jgi:hypothetical protein